MAGRGGEDKGGGCETGAWQEGGRSEPRADAKGSVLAPGEPVTKFLLTLARPGCHREVTELSRCHGQSQEQIALPGVPFTPPAMEIWRLLPMQIPSFFLLLFHAGCTKLAPLTEICAKGHTSTGANCSH